MAKVAIASPIGDQSGDLIRVGDDTGGFLHVIVATSDLTVDARTDVHNVYVASRRGDITYTLPPVPVHDAVVTLKGDGSFAATIDGNGKLVDGAGTIPIQLALFGNKWQARTVMFSAELDAWRIIWAYGGVAVLPP